MHRYLITLIMVILSAAAMVVRGYQRVVADSASRVPLPAASVYDRRGAAVGITDSKGRLPQLPAERYPITVRYLGFEDKKVSAPGSDTVFMRQDIPELKEVVVRTGAHRVLHILAYVREYSTLATYTDTVTLFREKMVDFILTPDKKVKFNGWSIPRTMTSRSYYRFTDAEGLDSVSDVFNQHFSWSDWMGMSPTSALPQALRGATAVTDTVRGRYSPTEVWSRDDNGGVTVEVDVMADARSRRWVPTLSGFFTRNVEFEQLKVRNYYEAVEGDSVKPLELARFSYLIESRGRGNGVYLFNRVDEPYFVSTSADVYILDKEYISVKEARKWEKHRFDVEETGIYQPLDAPELPPHINELIARVNDIDRDQVRRDLEADLMLVNPNYGKKNNNFKIGQRALSLLKGLTGISQYKFNKNNNTKWRQLKREQVRRNRKRK